MERSDEGSIYIHPPKKGWYNTSFKRRPGGCGPQGVLILRRLRHLRRTLRCAIWVFVLVQRQYSGTYTHIFFT